MSVAMSDRYVGARAELEALSAGFASSRGPPPLKQGSPRFQQAVDVDHEVLDRSADDVHLSNDAMAWIVTEPSAVARCFEWA
jgi:hypothetical protein